jgi:hypothetical protein
MKHKTKEFESVSELKAGTWIPVSVAALLSVYSTQSLRLFAFKGVIETGRFRVGPLLVNFDSVKKLEKRKN